MRLGIDLGTCLSCAAALVDGELKLVKDPVKHGYSFPSSVYVTERGEVLVGHAADNNRRKEPGRYKREFKRDWGNREPYRLGDRAFTPEELAAEVLRKLKTEADKLAGHRGATIDTALVTVPANYQLHKRTLVKQAGAAAGFRHVEILEEPVAAAIYYTWSGGAVEEGDILLVYDLGGGTFDAALIRRTGESFELLAPPVGLEHCGGVDFDRKIYADLQERTSPALRELLDPARRDIEALRARAVVADFCRDVKHQLSEALEASDEILLPRVDPETYELTRERFNAMIKPLLDETCELCRAHVRGAGVSWEQVKGVLLVGGSCRAPYVQEIVERQLGRPVLWVEDPELAVCKGAAIRGAALDGSGTPDRGAQHVAPPEPTPGHEMGAPFVVSSAGDTPYRSIGDALRAAAAGTRIVVRPGVYRESVALDRDVEITGDGPVDEIVVESVEASCVRMATAQATIRNLTLRLTAEPAAALPCVDVPRGRLVLEGCVVTSGSLACVAAHGAEAEAVLRGCTIRDGAQSGLFVYERAKALVENCTIERNAYSGIDVGTGAEPVVRDTRILGNKQCGICVFDAGRGVFTSCEITGNAISGVMVRQGGDPTVRECTIHDEKAGVLVSVNGKGTVERCDIVRSGVAGVEIKKGGDPTIVGCTIRDGKGAGLVIRDGGKGTVTDCTLLANAGADVDIQPGCAPVMSGNRIGPEQVPVRHVGDDAAHAAPRPSAPPINALELILPEQFFLICHDTTTGGLMGPESHIRYGLQASLLADLFLRGRLSLAPNGVVGVVNRAPTGSAAMDFVLSRIAGTPGALEMGRWIRHLDENWGHPQNSFGVVHDLLARRGAIPAHPPVIGEVPAREALVHRLRESVLGGAPIDEPLAVLFSLLRGCGVSGTIVSPHEIVSRHAAIDAIDARNQLGVALATRIVQLIAEDARGAPSGWAGVPQQR